MAQTAFIDDIRMGHSDIYHLTDFVTLGRKWSTFRVTFFIFLIYSYEIRSTEFFLKHWLFLSRISIFDSRFFRFRLHEWNQMYRQRLKLSEI